MPNLSSGSHALCTLIIVSAAVTALAAPRVLADEDDRDHPDPRAFEYDGRKDDDDDDRKHRRRPRYCSETARLQLRACGHEVSDDYFVARAICLQIPGNRARRACDAEARSARRDGARLCRDQRVARRDLCALVGEDRYVPDFDPARFDHDFRDLTNPNPYFPLRIGSFWDYHAQGESNRIEVLDKTKLIQGVTCIVVNDLVTKEDGGEDTDDWYAQARDGTVYYCGEAVQDFEIFEDDEPAEPELIAIDGSFKAGRDGDLPGTLFPGSPRVGESYRQEWSAGNAEDAATIVSTTYGFGNDPELDRFVPEALAELLCDDDCVVTGEVVPLEPDVFDLKYYARGVGLFFEVKPADGETNQLVACNVDPRCDDLPPR